MTAQIRSVLLLCRPPVLVLLCLYGALGLARHGLAEDHAALLRTALVVAGSLLFAVVCNDLSDVGVDRANLPGDARRPLATGALGASDAVIAGVAGALVASAVAWWCGPVCGVVATLGLVVSAVYSLPPLRLAGRGVVAPLVLPACYVAVPYGVGLLQAPTPVTPGDVTVLVALYVGFVGRIVLKDFRDVRGDALFGKRTFLVRHGRRATCRLSACAWTAGGALLVMTNRPASAVYPVVVVVATAAALVLLRALAASVHPRTDERLVSALAVVGRSTLLLTLVQLGAPERPWTPWLLLALAVPLAGQAVTMARSGPPLRPAGRRDLALLRSTAQTAAGTGSASRAVARHTSSHGVGRSPSSRSIADESST